MKDYEVFGPDCAKLVWSNRFAVIEYGKIQVHVLHRTNK